MITRLFISSPFIMTPVIGFAKLPTPTSSVPTAPQAVLTLNRTGSLFGSGTTRAPWLSFSNGSSNLLNGSRRLDPYWCLAAVLLGWTGRDDSAYEMSRTPTEGGQELERSLFTSATMY